MSDDQSFNLKHLRQAKFLLSAPDLRHSPLDKGIEIAFVGKSNSGKSSAINALVEQSNLARTSRTPGRTQLINYFEIDKDRRLVDLPGYGYAKVPVTVKRQIESILGNYLSQRRCLAGIVLTIDCRREVGHVDQQVLDMAKEAGIPVHILLTKSDKISRGAVNNSVLALKNELSLYGQSVSLQAFSALKGIGLEEALNKLQAWYTFDD